jgi:hypothetical protein
VEASLFDENSGWPLRCQIFQSNEDAELISFFPDEDASRMLKASEFFDRCKKNCGEEWKQGVGVELVWKACGDVTKDIYNIERIDGERSWRVNTNPEPVSAATSMYGSSSNPLFEGQPEHGPEHEPGSEDFVWGYYYSTHIPNKASVRVTGDRLKSKFGDIVPKKGCHVFSKTRETILFNNEFELPEDKTADWPYRYAKLSKASWKMTKFSDS